MVNLDDPKVYKRLDSVNMLAHLRAFPQQCYDAWSKARDFYLPEDYAGIDKVVILGMGGSAMGGDLLRSLIFQAGKPMVFVHRDYDLPAFVDNRTLVVGSSYSGNTEETLSAFSQALKSDCKKLVLTSGGKLKLLAEDANVPVFLIDIVGPPRAALAYSFLPLVAFLQKISLIQDKTAEVEAMIRDLEVLSREVGETVPIGSNRAKQLAIKLHGKIAVIYGAGILSEVARRWKTQLNENSKTWAFHEVFPELNHNAVVGYQFPQELAPRIHVVLLHSSLLHPRTLIRYQVTCELLKQRGVSHEIVNSHGQSELSHLMSLVFLGDWVSYYLALLYETDPTPVEAIEYLKKQMREVR